MIARPRLPMKYYVRGLLVGTAIALFVFALTGCGSEDTPAAAYHPECDKPPYCPPDFYAAPRPPSHPQPVTAQ